MTSLQTRLFSVCLLLALLLTAPSTAAAQVPGVQHVVIIGVDGMSPDGVQKAHTPVLNHLIATGAFSMHARAVLPSSSSQNWASMIMGAGPEQHGITSNEWEPDRFQLPSTVYAEDGYFPTIFYLLHTQRPDAVISVIYDWGGFGRLFGHASVDYAIDADGPQDAVDQAVAHFKQDQPTLTFIHLDHVDHAGHSEGHGSDAYYEAVEEADRLIGEVLDGLEAAGMREQTLVLVTADHGGRDFGHGGETPDQVEIPWILNGPGVVPGALPIPINTYDTAATVAYALGLQPPDAWIARPVTSAFEDRGEQPPYVPAPRIAPKSQLFVDTPPTVTLSADADAEIRYTLDGSTPTATSMLYTEPFPFQGGGTIRARTFIDSTGSAMTEAIYRFVESASGQGVNYSYYEGEGWQSIPDLTRLTPLRTGQVFEFDVQDVEHRDDHFAVRFDAYVQIDRAGSYTFFVESDDGSRLFVGGTELIDNDGSHGPEIRSGTLDLEAGQHHLTVTYFEDYGGQSLKVYYQGPDVPRQVLPPSVLTPAPADLLLSSE